jgi:hypothetical protein
MMKKMNHTNYCCKSMEDQVLFPLEEALIKFSPEFRSYDFVLHGKKYGAYRDIFYCPWCGTKLPKDLGEEWGELLEKEYGLEDPGWMKTEDLPKEFQTDEWWRKRGL